MGLEYMLTLTPHTTPMWVICHTWSVWESQANESPNGVLGPKGQDDDGVALGRDEAEQEDVPLA